VRLAVHGKQVVVLLGSDVALLDEALANLKDDKAGLAARKELSAFHRQAGVERKIELHVSVERFLALVSDPALVPGPLAKVGTGLSSFALGVAPNDVRLDLWVPARELRVIANGSGVAGR
jgi:hypothetical protein